MNKHVLKIKNNKHEQTRSTPCKVGFVPRFLAILEHSCTGTGSRVPGEGSSLEGVAVEAQKTGNRSLRSSDGAAEWTDCDRPKSRTVEKTRGFLFLRHHVNSSHTVSALKMSELALCCCKT